MVMDVTTVSSILENEVIVLTGYEARKLAFDGDKNLRRQRRQHNTQRNMRKVYLGKLTLQQQMNLFCNNLISDFVSNIAGASYNFLIPTTGDYEKRKVYCIQIPECFPGIVLLLIV